LITLIRLQKVFFYFFLGGPCCAFHFGLDLYMNNPKPLEAHQFYDPINLVESYYLHFRHCSLKFNLIYQIPPENKNIGKKTRTPSFVLFSKLHVVPRTSISSVLRSRTFSKTNWPRSSHARVTLTRK
jgi:hypothetical protein